MKRYRCWIIVLAIWCAGSVTGYAGTSAPPLVPVEHTDLNRFAGQWYEIAHYPNRFQDGCIDSVVTFALRKDGEFDVLNNCQDSVSGALRHADGRGWVVDKISNARFKVSYFWPFRNEYVIIEQGKDYEHAVIATVDRKKMWIIARTPELAAPLLERILLQIEKQGFHREQLIKTIRSKTVTSDEKESIPVHLPAKPETTGNRTHQP